MPQPDVHPLPGREIVVNPEIASGSEIVSDTGTESVGPASAVRLHVVEHGNSGTGRVPLLMLHGIPTTSYLWRDVARDLEHDRLCVMPDLVGSGQSERPTGRRSFRLEEQATLLERLLDELNIDRFAVLGTDLGGAVAVHLAARAGRRVAGLVLCGTPVHEQLWPTTPVLPLLPRGAGEVALGLLRLDLARKRPAVARRVAARALDVDG